MSFHPTGKQGKKKQIMNGIKCQYYCIWYEETHSDRINIFLFNSIEKPKGRLFSELLEDECPFSFIQSKGK